MRGFDTNRLRIMCMLVDPNSRSPSWPSGEGTIVRIPVTWLRRSTSRRERAYIVPLAPLTWLDSESVGGTQIAMHWYNLTVHHPTAISLAIVGHFSGIRQQEIIVSRGTRLELLRPDPHTDKTTTVIASDVFGLIRLLASFRLAEGTKGT